MKKVSSLWTLVPWIVPGWLVRFLPPWVIENVERSVYDGRTRHEWFAEEIARMQALNKAAAQAPSADSLSETDRKERR